MKLICQIEGASIFTADRVKELDGGELVIGRGAECGWVLNDPDRALSKQHCVLRRSAEGFTLTDTSTNGVFVDGARRPVGRGQTVPLSDGQLVQLGPYRIRVSVQADPAPAAAPVLPPSVQPAPEAWASALPSAGFDAKRPPVRAGWDAPPDPALLGATGLAGVTGADPFSPLAQTSEAASPLATTFRVPTPRSVLPADWNSADIENPLAPPPAPLPATPLPVAPARLLHAFLDGAELPPGLLDDADAEESFREFGRMLRIAVSGLRDLLAARKLAKAELRVESTTVQASGNNALKFSPDAERALRAVVSQPAPGFLPGAEALAESVRDIKSHELAMVATVSLLLADIATQLDPAVIKARTGEGGLLAASRRARWWDEFEAAYAGLCGGGKEDGEGAADLRVRFARAYAAQAQGSIDRE